MKFVVKKAMFIIALFIVSPFIFFTRLEALIFGKDVEKIFSSCKEILSISPTIIGLYLRNAYYWAACDNVSADARFLFGSWVAHRKNTIGPGVVVGSYTFIGYASIGENVLFGAGVSVVSGKYQHGRPEQRVQTCQIQEQHEVIIIGKNSWIGQNAILMANVGENCTVGVGSVVMRDVPDNTTVLGNPARKVNL